MAHTRIRKFNTKDTYPEQKLDNDLCQAVVTRGGRTVWMRGQCPQDLDTAENIESHDPVEQTHKVMQNIRQLVEEGLRLVLARRRVPTDGFRLCDASVGGEGVQAGVTEGDWSSLRDLVYEGRGA